MTISATIIADSISPSGIRLTTMQLRYPRFIHSEFMTHRVFSRNASSSRAIPVLTLLKNTVKDMAAPVEWGSNKPGMQAGEPLQGWRQSLAKGLWYGAGWAAAGFAYLLCKLGAHKQIANRVMEPWSHISVVVTATDWANWFALRNHPDADPTIQLLAQKMQIAMDLSAAKNLEPGEWHLPYVSEQELEREGLAMAQKMSAARCARVSYLTHGGNIPSVAQDLKLYSQLVESEPVHASPLEHQATPNPFVLFPDPAFAPSNMRGWQQFRKFVPNEAVFDV